MPNELTAEEIEELAEIEAIKAAKADAVAAKPKAEKTVKAAAVSSEKPADLPVAPPVVASAPALARYRVTADTRVGTSQGVLKLRAGKILDPFHYDAAVLRGILEKVPHEVIA